MKLKKRSHVPTFIILGLALSFFLPLVTFSTSWITYIHVQKQAHVLINVEIFNMQPNMFFPSVSNKYYVNKIMWIGLAKKIKTLNQDRRVPISHDSIKKLHFLEKEWMQNGMNSTGNVMRREKGHEGWLPEWDWKVNQQNIRED